MENTDAVANQPRLDVAESKDLMLAKSLLDHPGFAARMTAALGTPLRKGFEMLPPAWTSLVHNSVRQALWRALDVAVRSLDRPTMRLPRQLSYKMLVGATGGLGGAFGLAALPVELPVSTTIMLRGIAEVARAEGFDLKDSETRIACLEVFAFGGPVPENAPAESAYWFARSAVAAAAKDATVLLARRALIETSSPVLGRLIEAIAARFGTVVSQQLAAKAVPLLGGVAGSAINVIFMDHFQKVALGHFIVKRLETRHGVAAIRALYEQLPPAKDLRVAV
jgi:hypothetical protein